MQERAWEAQRVNCIAHCSFVKIAQKTYLILLLAFVSLRYEARQKTLFFNSS